MQKTAYEMRISDWSSDVCSSDLADDDRQHIVEIMRDAAGQLADGFHLLRLAQLRLRLLAVAHLAAQRNVRLGEFGGPFFDRCFELRRAVAFAQLLAPGEAAFALGADQRAGRADRDDRPGRAEQREAQDRLVEVGAACGGPPIAFAPTG